MIFFLIYITDWFWLETNKESVEISQIPDMVSRKVDFLGAHLFLLEQAWIEKTLYKINLNLIGCCNLRSIHNYWAVGMFSWVEMSCMTCQDLLTGHSPLFTCCISWFSHGISWFMCLQLWIYTTRLFFFFCQLALQKYFANSLLF